MNRKPVFLIADGGRAKYGVIACLGALESLPDEEYPMIVWRTAGESLEDAITRSRANNDHVLVIWSLYSTEWPAAVETLRSLKSRLGSMEGVTHILGGPHATAEPELCARAGFDYVVAGEGEIVFRELAAALSRGEEIDGISGVSLLRGDRFEGGRAPALESLDDSPSFALRQERLGPIEITRGCIYACKFCQTPYMFKARFRHRSISNVLQHVKAQSQRGMRDVRFVTPSAMSYGAPGREPDLDAVEALLYSVRRELPTSGRLFFGSFPSELRPEHATVESLTLIRKYADNNNVIIGAQSGSTRMLEACHRGHDSRIAAQAVENCRTVGLKANVDLIFGMPGETPEDIDHTITFAKKLVRLGARIHAHTFLPLPGTPWSHEKSGVITPDLRHAIDELASGGSLYGNWIDQETMAKELESFESFSNRHKMKSRPI